MPYPDFYTVLSVLLLACAALAAVPARAGLAYFDSFEGKDGWTETIVSAYPEVDWHTYAGRGYCAIPVVRYNDEHVLDAGPTLWTQGLALYGPPMAKERWERFDIPDASKAGIMIVPQVQTGAETSAAGLPAVWPIGGTDPWRALTTGFAGGQGGTVSVDHLDLAALYPSWDRTKPFHFEIHWRITGDTTALLEARAWNGDAAPPYVYGSQVIYTLASGTWSASARAGLAGLAGAGTGYISAMAEYDTAPVSPTFIAATDPNISYSGQWATVNGTERHTAVGGQRFQFVATGDSCRLRIRATGCAPCNPPVSIRVDGGPWRRLQLPEVWTDSIVTAYENQFWGPHNVEVLVSAIYGNDAYGQVSARFMLKGIELPPFGSVEALPFPDRKLLFVGDSLMSGFAVSDTALSEPNATSTSDARWAMPFIVGEWLGMDAVNLSVVGIGYCTQGDTCPGHTAIDVLQNALAGVPWQPDWEPEATILALGARDFKPDQYPDDVLQAAMLQYLAALRAKFPHTRIFLLRPLIGARDNVIQATLNAFADPNTQYVDTTGWVDMSPGHDITRAGHQKLTGNIKYARRVMAMLKDYLAYTGAKPTARVTLPPPGADVYGSTPVQGSALGNGFSGYTLEAGAGSDPSAWTPVATGDSPVLNGTLGLWNTSALPEGNYTLRLTVRANGQAAEALSTAAVIHPGDVDGDGRVSVADAAQALRIAAGLDPVAPERMPRVDVAPKPGPWGRPYGEGLVNVNDALAIARLALMP